MMVAAGACAGLDPGGCFAVKIELDGVGFIALGKHSPELFHGFRGEVDIVDPSRFAVLEVSVLGEIGAEAGRFPLVVYRPHKAAADEGLETVVDGGKGNGVHSSPGPGVDLVGGGVIALGEEDPEDVLTLACCAQPMLGERIIKGAAGFFWQ